MKTMGIVETLSGFPFKQKQPKRRKKRSPRKKDRPVYLDHPNRQKFLPFWKKAPFCCWRRFLFPWQRFFKIKFCAKTGSMKSAEFGGKSASFRGSRFQHVGVFVAFRRFFSRAAFSWLFGGKFCRRGLSAESSAAGGSKYDLNLRLRNCFRSNA